MEEGFIDVNGLEELNPTIQRLLLDGVSAGLNGTGSLSTDSQK